MDKKIDWGAKIWREGAKLPTKGTARASGYDVYAWTPICSEGGVPPSGRETIKIEPGCRGRIFTGVNLRIPDGYEVAVRPRSGLAFKHGVTVLNTPGTIDQDYLGNGESFELCAILFNSGNEPFHVAHGDRIAQIVLQKKVSEELVDDGDTDYDALRNGINREGGFGSTGVK
jgi:dUTP pyrophosphatase